jgi:hypothetical protein
MSENAQKVAQQVQRQEPSVQYRGTEKFVEFRKLTHVISRAHTKIYRKR